MQFDEVLKTFIRFFERESVEYALAGGLALVAWGHARSTHDVDFVVNGSDADRVIGFAESAGYRTLHVSPGYSNHRHEDEAFGNVDFMVWPYRRTRTDRAKAREYFAKHGLLKIYDELERTRE
jgi:hypothetical protein